MLFNIFYLPKENRTLKLTSIHRKVKLYRDQRLLKDQNPLKEVEFPLRTVWSHSNVCLQRPGHFGRVPTVSKLQQIFVASKKVDIMLLVLEIYIFELLKSCNIMSTQICSPFGHIFKTWWYSTKNCRNVKSNSFHDKCCFHPILVTWFLVVFGDEVTKILCNSLFIFHFVLSVLPCKQKTSYRKSRN